MVWEDARDGKADIYFARSDNAAQSFGDDVNISLDPDQTPGSSYSFSPRLEVSGDHAYVVWHDDRNGEGRDILLQYSADLGRNWLVSTQNMGSDAAGFDNSLYADLKVDRRTAHVVWQDARNTGYDIYYRRADGGVPMTEEVRVETDEILQLGQWPDRALGWYGRGRMLAPRPRLASRTGTTTCTTTSPRTAGSCLMARTFVDSMAPGQSYKLDVNVATVVMYWSRGPTVGTVRVMCIFSDIRWSGWSVR